MLEKTLESPLGCKEIKPVNPKGNQSWIFIGRTNAEAEAPTLWPPDAKNRLLRKDPDAGKDWRQEEKGMTEDEMAGWHHQLDGREFEQAAGVGDGQGSLVGCSPWVVKSRTWLSDWTDLCGEESTCQFRRCNTQVQSLIGKIPQRRKWQPTPVFLPGKSHGWSSLAGYSLWGCKESDTSKQLSMHTQEETPESLLYFLTRGTCKEEVMWAHSEKASICKSREDLSQKPDHVGTLLSDFQPPELWEIHFCCLSHSVCGILLWQPEKTKTLVFTDVHGIWALSLYMHNDVSAYQNVCRKCTWSPQLVCESFSNFATENSVIVPFSKVNDASKHYQI